MKKITKNNKYSIEWQFYRIQLKLIKDINLKLKVSEKIGDLFVENKNNDIKSLVNWIDGIAIVYKKNNIDVYNKFIDIKSKFKEYNFLDNNEVSTVEEIKNFKPSDLSQNIMNYLNSTKEFIMNKLLEDNLKRSNKWLKSYYNHKDLNTFIDNLYNAFPSNFKLYNENLNLRLESIGKKSQWKFLF